MPIQTSVLSEYDAGDTVTLVYTISHSSPTAYRLNLTVTYPTKYFLIDTNYTDSVRLILNGILQPNSSTVDPDNGAVIFSTDVLEPREFLVATMSIVAKNNVENADSYTIPHTLDWSNLPYGFDGGRFYNRSGELAIPIKTTQLSKVYTTSDENTPGNIVQTQEQIGLNVSVTLPEVRIDVSNHSQSLTYSKLFVSYFVFGM